jgi:hypothetical protein
LGHFNFLEVLESFPFGLFLLLVISKRHHTTLKHRDIEEGDHDLGLGRIISQGHAMGK